ncbi:hypothetical protein K1X84_10035 [bacterium]|nr:hypothetical protein [bacterium]
MKTLFLILLFTVTLHSQDRSLGIVTLVLNPVLQGDSVVWNGTDESAYLKALEDKLPVVFEQYSPIVFQIRRSKMNVNKHMLATAKTQTGFYVPSTQINIGGSKPSTILWLQDLHVSRLEDSLHWSCKYLMWDNLDEKVMGYGILQACMHAGDSGIDWDAAAIKFGEQLKMQMATPEVSPVYIVTTGSQNKRVAMRFKAMGHLNFHLPKKDQGDPYVPDEYENLRTHPSITQYFSNAPSFTPSVEIVFPQKISNIILGMDFNFESLESSGSRTLVYSSEGIPNETLHVRTIGFLICYSQKFNDFSDAYWFVKGRLDFKKYSGKSHFTDFTIKLNFDEAVAPGLSFGVEGKPSGMLFGLSAELGFSFASTNLTSASIGGDAVPIDFKLADNQIYLKAGIFYDWKW